MPIQKHWIVACDGGCGKSFQAHGDVSEAGIDTYLPASWLMVKWRRDRQWQVRYFSSPNCMAHWGSSSKEPATSAAGDAKEEEQA